MFSRVTLIGERRRVDAVLPSGEPVGLLLPDVLRLLGDVPASQPHHRYLATADGDVLPWEGTLAASGIEDGALLRLVRADDAPPAPVVHDVTEEASADIDLRIWRWGPAARRWTATVLAGALFFVVAAVFAKPWLRADRDLALGAMAAMLAMGGGLLGRYADEPTGTAITAASAGLAFPAAWVAADAYAWPVWERWGSLVLIAAALLAVLGVSSRLGFGGVLAAGFGCALTATWMAGGAANVPTHRLAAVIGVASITLLGLLPRLALSTSGLAALDDRRTTGSPVSRYDVGTALAATHRGLAGATVATAVSAAVAGTLLAAAPNRWTVPLAILFAVVLASRSRTFPLVVQVIALQGAAIVVLIGLLMSWRDQGAMPAPLAGAVALAVVPIAVLAARPAEHIRVRLRRACDRVEALAVVAMIPLVIGVFGTYGRLLHSLK